MTGRLRIAVEGLSEGELTLPDAASRYVARVHRARVGDRLELFDPARGERAEAEVVALGRAVRCLVQAVEQAPDVGALPVRLALALGKGDKPEQGVRDATALGVREVVLLTSARVQGARRGPERPERLRAVAASAARQSGRATIPAISGPIALERWAGELPAPTLLLDPRGDASLLGALKQLTPGGGALITLLIGPEGGFSDDERARLVQAGAHPVRLGAHVLRTETAVTAALGAVVAYFGAR